MAVRLNASGSAYALNQNAEINVTPFVDVMLVLLIIFMVAIPAATVSVKVDLPPARAAAQPQVAPTYVSVQQGGGLYIGDRPTTLATLSADLAAAIGTNDPRNERVYIRADVGVRYGDFMTVMNTLKADGFQRVALVSEAV
ncbi:biopolymer transporter ExbD [Phenylobacterium sp. J367]|uniref:biopolymer transporter ExbD n=1 Tax=Phenylobacterium sp. J367 TaxID=2898435 RepID=UPI002151C7DB|nr:biopolymer transporter ExbD [Phenylobacterium sp. J367]MCR5877832.1 biopolymer transporter ExbD [Phenylobacterium sp. J367]